MHHLHQTELLNENQYGFIPHKNTIDAEMETRKFIEPELEKRRVVIMVSLDVRGAFHSAWRPAILKRLRDPKCPPKSLPHTGLPKKRKAVINIYKFNIEKRIT